MPSGDGYAFGPFHLEGRSKRLLRDGVPIDLPLGQFLLLQALVSRAGQVLTKEDLVTAAWDEKVVEDNTLAKAILRLRRALDPDEPEKYIATVARRGYRFVAEVSTRVERLTDADFDALVAPHRALVDGRAALEMLTRDEVTRALALLEPAVQRYPHQSGLHVALATALMLKYDATRLDAEPDRDSLGRAERHAREACLLNGEHATAFMTLGFVLDRLGAHTDAVAMLNRAVSLEGRNWRHHFGLAWVSWGEDRIAAAHRALALIGHCPAAHWLIATVLVARNELADAEREVDAGLAERDAEADAQPRYGAVGLDLLKGLLLVARGADDEGLAALDQEIARESGGHVYSRACAADAYYAIGAIRLRHGDTPAARAGFDQAIARSPRHPMAHAGLALIESGSGNQGSKLGRLAESANGSAADGPLAQGTAANSPRPLDVALAQAAMLAGRSDAAAPLVEIALAAASPGSAGWQVPIDPLLDVQRDRPAWRRVLAQLTSRAV